MTIPQAFEIAVQRHQAGRLAEAEALYRQILTAQPNHSGALHLLGVVAHQAGRDDLAWEWIRQAIVLDPNNAIAHFNLGEVCRTMGRLDDAIAAYQRALLFKPDFLEAHVNLGNALRERGRLDDAMASFRGALHYKPDLPEAHNNLGNALRDRGRLDEAIGSFRRALQFKPDYAEAHANLGNALRDMGRQEEAIVSFCHALRLKPDYPAALTNLGETLRGRGQCDEALAACRRALELKPDFPDAHNNLGNALGDLGRLDEAIASYGRALEIKPGYAEAHANLGNVLRQRGRFDEAIAACRRALELKPDFSEAHTNLGNALRNLGRLDEAIAAYRRALELKPDFPAAETNLGNALWEQGQCDEVIAAYRRALELHPGYREALNNLGAVLAGQGQLDEAIAFYRQALDLQPDSPGVHSNLIHTLHYHPGHDGEMISEERQRWNRRFGDPLKPFLRPHANDRNPDRPLRIGYVSPDFWDHVVGRNLVPLFENHDRRGFEIFCYSGGARSDGLTEEFRRRADQWRSTMGVSDETLAEMIRRDSVDILVDLAQHTAGNRLPMFARQPAPVQVSFVGSPESAGLEAIEYRISDRHLEASLADEGAGAAVAGLHEAGFGGSADEGPEVGVAGLSEAGFGGSADERPGKKERVYLIDSFWCYDPCGIEVEVHGLPALESGRVTFGSLNDLRKLNERTLRLWARVLGKVKDSRLMIRSPAGSRRDWILETLRGGGVEARRVEFVGPRPRREYLELYHQVDIVLDTFPYNGHTTSLDALWMGVPVVSLAGNTAVSRGGLSQLTNLGLPELAARSEAEFVDIAAGLARDLPRLEELRSTLRARMKASVLMDAPRFARNIEAAYRVMWKRWCSQES